MQYFQGHRHLQSWFGYVLFCGGLVGDWTIGERILTGASLYLLLLHIPTAVVWALGINLIDKQDACQVVTIRTCRMRVKGLSVAALVLSLCTFPGFGPLVYSVALVAANCLPQRRRVETADAIVAVPEQLATPDLEIQPLIEVLDDCDTETKRAAVTVLSREAHSEAMRLLRQLLSDPHAEIRSDASVALTRRGDELFRALRLSFEQWIAKPEDREQALKLADQYASFARSNVLDEMSQHFYLLKARDLLLQVLMQERMNAELWIKLARLRQSLGELPEALHDIRIALRLQPVSREAYLLAMELAFCVRSWGNLVTFAREALSVLPNFPEAQTALQWAFHTDLGGGPSHG